jgi:hypothetical protein
LSNFRDQFWILACEASTWALFLGVSSLTGEDFSQSNTQIGGLQSIFEFLLRVR